MRDGTQYTRVYTRVKHSTAHISTAQFNRTPLRIMHNNLVVVPSLALDKKGINAVCGRVRRSWYKVINIRTFSPANLVVKFSPQGV